MTTISDSSRKAPDSSLSRPTVQLHRCEATIELGRRLTKELGLDQSVDTLGRWMAHYVAELIEDAGKASEEARPEKMRACREAILKLWVHRQNLPDGHRPFQDLEPMLRTLASLDPENDTQRYFPSARTAASDPKESDQTKSWLQLIEDLDHSARILIRYCLSQAAETAIDKSAEWVRLAKAAGADEGAEHPLVRVILQEKDVLKVSDPNEIERVRIDDRIKRLEAFATMAMAVASQLRKTNKPTRTPPKKNPARKKYRK